MLDVHLWEQNSKERGDSQAVGKPRDYRWPVRCFLTPSCYMRLSALDQNEESLFLVILEVVQSLGPGPRGSGLETEKRLCSHLPPASLGEIRFKWWPSPALNKGREISKEYVWKRWGEGALVHVTAGEGGGLVLKEDLSTWISKRPLSPHPHPHCQPLWSPIRWQLHWEKRRRVHLPG